jgi:hypothetical protein
VTTETTIAATGIKKACLSNPDVRWLNPKNHERRNMIGEVSRQPFVTTFLSTAFETTVATIGTKTSFGKVFAIVLSEPFYNRQSTKKGR